ncbi:MAG TPA: diguanylate cyclase [Candidatus Dormibacteraeota bacterium]
MRRLSFSARFALILTVLGALIAGSTVALFLALTGGQTRQAALERVADRAQTATDLVRAEQASLAAFATTAAGQLNDAGDPTAFLVRLSRAAGPQDLVAVVSPSGLIAAQAGTAAGGGGPAWIRDRATASDPASHSGLAADAQGRPWIYAWAPVPAHPGTVAVAARPLASSAVAQLATRNELQTGGLVVATRGRAVIGGTLAGQQIPPGEALPPAVAGQGSTSSIVGLAGQDVAAVAAPLGDGFDVVATSAVSTGGSPLQSVAVLVALVSAGLIVIGLTLLYLLVRRDLQRPLRRLDRAVTALADEDFSVPIGTDGNAGNAELARLGASFEDMRRELQAMLRGAEARAAIAADLSSHPLSAAIDRVCAQLRATTNATRALAVLVDDEQRPRSLHVSGGDGRMPAVSALTFGNGAIAAAMQQAHPGPLVACSLPGSAEAALSMTEIAVTPLRMGTTLKGALAISDRPGGFTRHDLDLLALAADQLALATERERVLELARIQANTDGLTGLYNRGFLTDYLEQQIAHADRSRVPLTLLMLDVDNFKAINDSFGHQVGDSALRSVARTLLANLRRSDLAARLGGDEFVVVMGETGTRDAVVVAEKLRDAVARTQLQAPDTGQRVQLSVSIGVAGRLPRGVGVDRLLTLADNALYEAKRSGRDRVRVAPDAGALVASTPEQA